MSIEQIYNKVEDDGKARFYELKNGFIYSIVALSVLIWYIRT